MTNKAHQQGFLSLDMAIGLMVLSIVITLATLWQFKQMDAQDYRIAADQQKTIAQAQVKYLKDNFAAVLANATPTVPVHITVPMLINTHYLPEGFSATNLFGQTILGLARKPNPNQLEVIVVTTGGQPIPEMGIRAIAEHLGGPGGFISKTDPNVVQGIRGGWQVALSNYAIAPGPGHTASALFLMDGTLANDYLYRNAVPGRPELNAMNTDLGMGANNINDAGNITATGNVSARNVIATADVSGATANIAGETYTGGWFRTRGDTGWYSEKWGGGWYMSDPNWIRAYADKDIYTAGQVRAGTLVSEGRSEVGEYLNLIGLATEHTACSPNGLIGRNTEGLTLSCQSGLWKGASSGPGKLINAGTYWGRVTRTNTATTPIYVNAYGGNGYGGTCGNVYQMSAAVYYGSWITVSESVHTYDLGTKSTSTGFMVPGGSSYSVSSHPYQCGLGVIYLTEFTP